MKGRPRRWIRNHPRLANGAILSVGMVIILWIAAYDRGLTTAQLAAMTVMCVAVAGLCAWIVGWE